LGPASGFNPSDRSLGGEVSIECPIDSVMEKLNDIHVAYAYSIVIWRATQDQDQTEGEGEEKSRRSGPGRSDDGD
jgi:hypothetical protein